jgi:CheY-like chemotaxis protein
MPSPLLTPTSSSGPGATRVLVVDDDDELRQSLCDLLEAEGLEAAGVASGQAALAALGRPRCPDVIVLDLMMSDMNGWQFREAQLRDRRIARIPVIVATASRNLAEQPIAADAILLKPFSLERLLEQIIRLTLR